MTEILSYINSCEKEFRESVNSCADEILKNKNIKYTALSGPTCSGKTTTAKILTEKLKDHGLKVKTVSIDDFFFNREDLINEAQRNGTPPDMDSVKAIDIEALRSFVLALENGERAYLPHYDFVSGMRDGYERIEGNEFSLYIFEGIQAFYPEVLSLFKRDEIILLYISVMAEYKEGTCTLSPTEQRLMRRIIRDKKFRDTSAEKTLKHWDEVVKNERLHIDPFKDKADIKIDSTMPYGLGVMKKELLEVLSEVEGRTAEKYVQMLKDINGIDEKHVPKDSVLREFIG